MVLIAQMKKSTGKARCLLCGKPIKENQKRILVIGYNTQASLHSTPGDCIEGRQ